MDLPSESEIIKRGKRLKEERNGPWKKEEVLRKLGLKPEQFDKIMGQRPWARYLAKAGLQPHPRFKPTPTDEDLIRDFLRVCEEERGIPIKLIVTQKAGWVYETFTRRFGGRRKLWGACYEYLLQNDPDSFLIGLFLQKLKTGATRRPQGQEERHGTQAIGTLMTARPTFGNPISFKGLLHEPTSEHGVIFLFGMLCANREEFGFMVRGIGESYPDCEALRLVGKEGKWQPVSIEFEFKSSSFQAHAHDPEGCDLIVCWEDDWAECPLEVIELKSVVATHS